MDGEAAGGNIIFISSISGLKAGLPLPYAAAKAAVIRYAKTIAISLASKKIRVNTIAPGSIEFEGGRWANAKINNTSRAVGGLVLPGVAAVAAAKP